MTNPVIGNVRLALGRTAQTPLSLRPNIYEPRLPESADSERYCWQTREDPEWHTVDEGMMG